MDSRTVNAIGSQNQAFDKLLVLYEIHKSEKFYCWVIPLTIQGNIIKNVSYPP